MGVFFFFYAFVASFVVGLLCFPLSRLTEQRRRRMKGTLTRFSWTLGMRGSLSGVPEGGAM